MEPNSAKMSFVETKTKENGGITVSLVEKERMEYDSAKQFESHRGKFPFLLSVSKEYL